MEATATATYSKTVTIYQNWNHLTGFLSPSNRRGIDEKATKALYEIMLRQRMASVSPMFAHGIWQFEFAWTTDQPKIAVDPVAGVGTDTAIGKAEDALLNHHAQCGFWVERPGSIVVRYSTLGLLVRYDDQCAEDPHCSHIDPDLDASGKEYEAQLRNKLSLLVESGWTLRFMNPGEQVFVPIGHYTDCSVFPKGASEVDAVNAVVTTAMDEVWEEELFWVE